MPLQPGTRLGAYEILGLLGAGGMGEVYRAKDTRLDRTVAIKILGGAVAADSDLRQRFEREARAIASLSHPNVCALHDVGSANSTETGLPVEYLVMEFLAGETLADRLTRGPLPLSDFVRAGSEIAGALDAAHRQRIVHRDLKPSNVMVTKSGVKLLDFGLAKAVSPLGEVSVAGLSTLTGMTVPGTILGTLPYMSPEQIEGREADARSDIFALGSVLYEMATGRRAFAADSPAGVASAILSSDPAPIAVSPALDAIVRGCLRKDPDQRWQSAQDVALQLRDVEARDRAAPAGGSTRTSLLPWMVAGIALAVALAAVVMAWRAQSVVGSNANAAQAPPLRFTIPIAGGADAYLALSVERPSFAISPDGRTVAMAAGNAQRELAVWVRPLASETATMVPGTEGADSVFWSPDSRSLGFFSRGKLKRVDLAGGAPVTVCDVQQGIGLAGSWGDSQILFASVQGEAIFSVPASGGTATELVKPNAAAGEERVPWPTFLPDGRTFMYLSSHGPAAGAVMMRSPDGTTKEVMPIRSNVAYVEPGFLVYGVEGVVLARRFNPATAEMSGEPIALAEGVTHFGGTGITQFSASRTGALLAHSGADLGRLLRFDREGKVVAEIRSAGPYSSVRLSLDRRELFVDRADPATGRMDIWKIDLERGGESRVTSEIAAGLEAAFAPDGSMIFSAARLGPPRLYRRTGSGPDVPLVLTLPGMQSVADVAPDGRSLVYSQRTRIGNFDLMVVSLPDGAVTPFHQSAADERGGRFSPDGHTIAYTSDLGGRVDVYVAPFPGPGPARIVSTTSGALPRWSADGRTLFYVGSDGTVYATPIGPGATTIGRPQVLFTRGSRSRWQSYETTTDGQFIALEPTASAAEQPLRVILNWPSLVR